MAFYADPHVRSGDSRATSRGSNLEPLALHTRNRGASIVGTVGFTRPERRVGIGEKIVPAEQNLRHLRPDPTRSVERQFPAAGGSEPSTSGA